MFEIMNNTRRSSNPNNAQMFYNLEVLLKDGAGLVFTKDQSREVPGNYQDPERLDEDKNLDFEDKKKPQEKDPNNVDPRGPEAPSKYAPGTQKR